MNERDQRAEGPDEPDSDPTEPAEPQRPDEPEQAAGEPEQASAEPELPDSETPEPAEVMSVPHVTDTVASPDPAPTDAHPIADEVPVVDTVPVTDASTAPDGGAPVETGEPAEPEGAEEVPAAATRPPRRRAVRVLSALVVLLAVSTAVFAYLWTRSPEEEVRQVAERVADNLVNFDYRTIDNDVRAIRSDATGSFLEQFTQALDGGVRVFRDAIVDAEGRSTGTVEWVTVGEIEQDTAMAVVRVSQSVTNTKTPDPVTEPRTMQLSLIRTPSGWKVDDVTLL